MNAHVALFCRWQCFVAREQRRQLAQLYWYTQAMLEVDPSWKP